MLQFKIFLMQIIMEQMQLKINHKIIYKDKMDLKIILK